MQKMMIPKLKKVYPLSFCEIRVIETNEISKIDLEKIIELAKTNNSEENLKVVEENLEEVQEEVINNEEE